MPSLSREKILIRTSWVSAIGNAVLSLLKITVGIWGGSLAVLGDGIDSATDVVISIVMIFTAHIVNKPPSRKYVYGYEKAESIATKVLSLVIFYAGLQMMISSIDSFFTLKTKEIPSHLVIYVILFSIVGKLLLALYQHRQGKKINSLLLKANATNMRNDVLISVGVLVGLAFTFIFKLPLFDSITGLLISLFIIKTGVSIFMDANIELMDGVKDDSVYDKIFKAVAEVPGASNPHRVRSRQIGNLYMVVLDVEADGDITLKEAHDIAHQVEKSIKATVENIYDIVVHIEPKGTHPQDEVQSGLNQFSV